MTNNSFEHIDLGPLEVLLEANDIAEIMVNGMHGVYVERGGKIELEPDVVFKSEAHIIHLMQQIATAAGRELSAQNPIVDVRLPDDSRVNLVLPPVAADGPTMVLRRMPPNPLTIEDLIRFNSIDEKVLAFLKAVMQAPINVLISGGTGSGKTTLQNLALSLVPDHERIVVVEGLLMLQLTNSHVVRLECVEPDANGRGGVDILDLMTNARKMRADRIVTSEVKGPEAWEMMHIMCDGYDGSVMAIHADNVQDALQRLEMMSTAASNLPLLHIRQRIAQSIQIVFQQTRLQNGKRRIVSISTVDGIENNIIRVTELMRYAPETDSFVWTGQTPGFSDQLELEPGFFDA